MSKNKIFTPTDFQNVHIQVVTARNISIDILQQIRSDIKYRTLVFQLDKELGSFLVSDLSSAYVELVIKIVFENDIL